jgi:hypothetical protein
MSHNISERKREAREHEFRLKEMIAAEIAGRRELAFAGRVIAIWNARLARGADLFFAPTIGGAVAAGLPMLTFYCPGCGVIGTVDLRRLDRHPRASVESLIPALSCRRCRPQAPFVRLTGLERVGAVRLWW